jgi:hypothetical protein
MSKLIVKSLERAGEGEVVGADVSIKVSVTKLVGRSSYAVQVDGVCKGISRVTPRDAWLWLIDYLGVWEIVEPEPVTKKVKKTKVLSDSKK